MDRDTSQVTEEEMAELMDNDGELRDEEFTKEEATEEETSSEEDGEEESDDEEAEEEESTELDWESLPPAAKKAYEEAAKKAEHWEKNHAKLQSDYAKNSNSWKEKESAYSEAQAKAAELDKWEKFLESNTHARQALEAALAKEQNPFADMPEHLSKDPAVKYMQEKFMPYISKLEKELEGLKGKTGELDTLRSERIQAEGKAKLDTQLDASKAQIKAMLGREATEDEVTKVLEYMVENKFYGNGKAAALAVFSEQYDAHMQQKYNQTMKEKAKKFPSQSKTVSSSRATTSTHAKTPEEAIMMAMQEQGYGG